MNRIETRPCCFISDAGLRDGMRVLDIGCRRGDVGFLAAGLVGTRGEVLGIDSNEAAIRAALEWARLRGFANVPFARADLGAPTASSA
jgi:ubiquinone/menaquinone biosynthesis C-methylase UbiE